MSLREVVLYLNVAFLVGFPPLAYVQARRGVLTEWKRPFAVGMYLSILAVTVLALTDETRIASYPDVAFALDMAAGVAALASFVFLYRSRRARKADLAES